jgi:sporulation protein YlmC with PRC-barrel domain
VKRIDDLLGMPIVTVAEGRRVGRLKGVEIDVTQGALAYLRFDAEGSRADGVVPWNAVRSIGADAITIEALGAVQETVPHAVLPNLTSHVSDRPVVTESGTRLGTINTYDVDEVSGRILWFHVPNGGLLARLSGKDLAFGLNDIVSFGRDAIVVSDRVCAEEKAAA